MILHSSRARRAAPPALRRSEAQAVNRENRGNPDEPWPSMEPLPGDRRLADFGARLGR
ncbi:MAG: hypothetical protein AVDCRST_MAG18-4061 [uncultured Thermomicrobiales bacterium]|uniref:Uncharacterized protein n=1 Tax=uncultured Thermomicrobiales bacterium TaxID=1645740 RepID=A0A6J4VY39_9BACT|nr:MAG: hypothetical protein AVDCRST_MAG18-4061 [uncultured Thermomicrobiales bacterium]